MSYKTIKNECIYEETEKRSRFISHSFKVMTSQEAQEKLQKIKSIHKTAKHWVYAYVIYSGQEEKYCDDGEPPGTSGLPLMGAIKSLELQKVMIVTVRYFGGILLGTSGLRKMYGSGAAQVLKESGVVTMRKVNEIEITCSYNQYGKLTNIISEFGGKIEKTTYLGEVSFKCTVPSELLETVIAKVKDITRSESKIKILSDTFASI